MDEYMLTVQQKFSMQKIKKLVFSIMKEISRNIKIYQFLKFEVTVSQVIKKAYLRFSV